MTARQKSLLGSVLVLTPVVTGLTVRPSFAYIDPGTGSYVLQAIAATVLAGFFVVKTSWGQLRERISNLFHKKTPAGPTDGR